jgi:hypothetical protein
LSPVGAADPVVDATRAKAEAGHLTLRVTASAATAHSCLLETARWANGLVDVTPVSAREPPKPCVGGVTRRA